MIYTTEAKHAVITGWNREQLAKLKELPTTHDITGNRFKFVPNPLVNEKLREIGVLNVPVLAVQKAQWQIAGPDAWDFKTAPLTHQKEKFYEWRNKNAFALLWEMGLGKTKTCLDIAAWRYLRGDIDCLFVVTLNGVHRNWILNEVPKHLHDNTAYKADFWAANRKEEKLEKLFKHEGLLVFSMNIDALSTKRGEVFARKLLLSRRCMFVIDESHTAKNPSASRTKTLLKLRDLAQVRAIMTGTVVTNSPMDVYTQYTFLSPDVFSPLANFHQFRARYAVLKELPNKPRVKIEVGYQRLDELKARIDPLSTRLTKEQCLDLPDKIYMRHPFDMREEQAALYKKLARAVRAEFNGKPIAPNLAITRLLRLHQIACGFIVPDTEEDQPLAQAESLFSSNTSNPRIDAMMDILEQVQGKAIIWATYRFSLHEVAQAIRKRFGAGTFVGYSGATPADARPALVERFQDPQSPVRFFIGQPRAGGTGITLTAAGDVLYYSNDYSLNIRLQSEDRAHRIGQTKSVTYHDLEATGTIDKQIITSLCNKLDVASNITGDKLVQWLKEEDAFNE